MSSPVKPDRPGPVNNVDEETERLVALLTPWKVTAKVARELVREFPERIVPQVEAHRHRNVTNPPGSLVVAIRENWPTDPPQPRMTSEERREAARKAREEERQADLYARSARNVRKRAEDEKVKVYWEGLTEQERMEFDQQAIEASPQRDVIRDLDPDSHLYRGQRASARWEYGRRKLGLPVRD